MTNALPEDLHYTADHEWLDLTDGVARVGITAFAAEALGDVVYVEVPPVGTQIAAGEPCGELESTKSVSDLFAPARGEVTALNQAVVDDPGLVNADPFGAGWLFEMSVSDLPDMLDATAYAQLTAKG